VALYHLSAKAISRGSGQSAVAAAAYRSGSELVDERTGQVCDYTRKQAVIHTEIMAPDNAPDWMRDRSQLWNAVEAVEKRKDSQLAREVEVALPRELSREQQLVLVRGFVREQFVEKGMVADFAIHAPKASDGKAQDHSHILLTQRDLIGGGFGKKNRDWNSDELLCHWRKAWADHCNVALERAGSEARVDHRNLKDQGIDRVPTIHLGPAASRMEARGQGSDRGRIQAEIIDLNHMKADLAKQAQAKPRKRRPDVVQKPQEAVRVVPKAVEMVNATPQPPPQGASGPAQAPVATHQPSKAAQRPQWPGTLSRLATAAKAAWETLQDKRALDRYEVKAVSRYHTAEQGSVRVSYHRTDHGLWDKQANKGQGGWVAGLDWRQQRLFGGTRAERQITTAATEVRLLADAAAKKWAEDQRRALEDQRCLEARQKAQAERAEITGFMAEARIMPGKTPGKLAWDWPKSLDQREIDRREALMWEHQPHAKRTLEGLFQAREPDAFRQWNRQAQSHPALRALRRQVEDRTRLLESRSATREEQIRAIRKTNRLAADLPAEARAQVTDPAEADRIDQWAAAHRKSLDIRRKKDRDGYER